MSQANTAHAAAAHLPTERGILDGLETPREQAAQVMVRQPVRLRTPLFGVAWWRWRVARYTTLAVLLLSGSLAAYLLLRPVPQPDYAADPMDDVLNYTLLTDEFNKLPVDKRL